MMDLNSDEITTMLACLISIKAHVHPLVAEDINKLIDKLGSELEKQLTKQREEEKRWTPN